jgi:hypothetical protein
MDAELARELIERQEFCVLACSVIAILARSSMCAGTGRNPLSHIRNVFTAR